MNYRKLSCIVMAVMAVLLLGWTTQSQAQDQEFQLSQGKSNMIGTWTLTTDERLIDNGLFSPTAPSPFAGSVLEVTDVTSNLLEGSLISTVDGVTTTVPVVGVIGRANQIKISLLADTFGFITIEGLLVSTRKISATFVRLTNTGVGTGHFKADRVVSKKK